MKNVSIKCAVVGLIFGSMLVMNVQAEGMVFFRGAWSHMSGDRGGEVFTDTADGLGEGTGKNDSNNGFAVGAGLDTDLDFKLLFGDVLGEIFIEYSEFSRNEVLQTTSALLGGDNKSKVTVNQLSVIVAPKLQWEVATDLRTWVIPVGLGFLVSSPPSDNTAVLDLGLHFGAGVDYVVYGPIVVGADVRYTLGFERQDTESSYLSVGAYTGIKF
ncbi:hypothetical protein ACFLQL_02240 [Verrucomicrobiota bacterium]